MSVAGNCVELESLLSDHLSTFYQQAPAGVGDCIVYQIYASVGETYESGLLKTERQSYRVTVYTKAFSPSVIAQIHAALRGDGWTINDTDWGMDTENKHHQVSINIQKTEAVTDD